MTKQFSNVGTIDAPILALKLHFAFFTQKISKIVIACQFKE